MALHAAPSASFLHVFLPIAQASLRPMIARPILQRWQPSLLPAISISIPNVISDLWESVLRAVPKKKTSHMKKRHRQMAGKALKDVTALNKCSSCGRTKRAHILCPYCVASVKRWFSSGFTSQSSSTEESLKLEEPEPTQGVKGSVKDVKEGR